ncbi:hypothetical protein IMZ48_19220 [Candidatus Bathyarchaeota archaeon]|nr:hypothetical protein [Candidatus Bathyarchaeota archaeon]
MSGKQSKGGKRAPGGSGFGTKPGPARGFGFGHASSGSQLSYVAEPPDLSSISDAHVVVSFKNLLKKDSITKTKALEDLLAYVRAHPHEEGGGAEEAILEAWVCEPPPRKS